MPTLDWVKLTVTPRLSAGETIRELAYGLTPPFFLFRIFPRGALFRTMASGLAFVALTSSRLLILVVKRPMSTDHSKAATILKEISLTSQELGAATIKARESTVALLISIAHPKGSFDGEFYPEPDDIDNETRAIRIGKEITSIKK